MSEVLHILVRGRVQGVGFRQFTQDTALRMGVAGWVRNLPDGRVETVVRVTLENKSRFIAALRQGPSLSHVDHLAIEPAPQDMSCPTQGFKIRH